MTKHYRKICSGYLLLIIVFLAIISSFSYTVHAESPFDVTAKSAILMDYNSGEILYEKNPAERLPIASINKIMTLLLAYESIDLGELQLDDKVTISEHAASMGGSQVFLHEGEALTVDTLLKAIIIASANDASVALAEKLAGSHEVFVQKMNERAKELGMKDTNFVNATGLPADNSYSTAYDVALMSKELLNHPLFHRWSTVWVDTLEESRNKTDLANTNRLIRFYEGTDGIKTGSTNEAGYCLSATTKRGDMRLISIVLGATTSKIRFSEATKLMDFGFTNYKSISLVKKGQEIQNDIEINGGKTNLINGIAAKDICLLLKADQAGDFEKTIVIDEELRAPVEKGEKIGTLNITLDGKRMDSVDIVSDRDVDKAGILDYFKKIFGSWIRK